ncbi:hypothetical protein SAMN05216486_1181 [bacterium JGI 053]|nr:hypothetical protein SAMN05216486_1181 [bacterium JGI 053]
MRSSLQTLALVAACAAASLAASQCASPNNSRSASTAAAVPEAPRLAPATWTPQSTPAQIAEWALDGCGRAGSRKQECLEGALTSVLGTAGVDKAMGALLILSREDQDVARDGHVYAHGIGIAAYKSPETVAQTFALCTADFQSGCYHGVIQAYFGDSRGTQGGVTPAKLNGLCQPYRAPDKRWLEFQCAHGIGHGVMAVESHNLLRALDSCDILADSFEKQACWGGAFMENVVNATSPHHMHVTRVADVGENAEHGDEHAGHGGDEHAAGHDSAAHAAAGHDMAGHDMAGHDMSAMEGHGDHAAAQPFMALDPHEPLYPCTVVQERHKPACYLMQTSAILHANNGDFPDAARQCGRSPEAYRYTCYVSLGRDANSWSRGSREQAIAYCRSAPDIGQSYCIIGVVKNIVDVTADPRDGLSFCALAPDATKPACYNAVGQEIALLQPTAPGREQACRAAASGYVPECRRGAGLPLIPGDG